jgi:hypothetical protein
VGGRAGGGASPPRRHPPRIAAHRPASSGPDPSRPACPEGAPKSPALKAQRNRGSGRRVESSAPGPGAGRATAVAAGGAGECLVQPGFRRRRMLPQCCFMAEEDAAIGWEGSGSWTEERCLCETAARSRRGPTTSWRLGPACLQGDFSCKRAGRYLYIEMAGRLSIIRAVMRLVQCYISSKVDSQNSDDLTKNVPTIRAVMLLVQCYISSKVDSQNSDDLTKNVWCGWSLTDFVVVKLRHGSDNTKSCSRCHSTVSARFE